MNKRNYTLYLCTDRTILKNKSLDKAVEEAILGGVTMVQLREKECSSLEFFEIAKKIKKVTDAYHVPLIINDRLDIALAIDADGVHIGQSDLPLIEVRKILGQNKLIGVSVTSVEEALQAQNNHADYLGVGAMYYTETKKDAKVVNLEQLISIRQAIRLPLVIIGGINERTLMLFKGIGIEGIAVVSAILGATNIQKASKELVNLWNG